jgi:hypothetical protein
LLEIPIIFSRQIEHSETKLKISTTCSDIF